MLSDATMTKRRAQQVAVEDTNKEKHEALSNENIRDRERERERASKTKGCLFKSVGRTDDGQRSLICNRLLTVHLVLLEVIKTIWKRKNERKKKTNADEMNDVC